MKDLTTTQPHKNLFRLTGVLYLLVIIFAGTSQGYIRGTFINPGDISQTAQNILQNPSLFKLGITFDLIAFLLDVTISVLFYQLLKPVGKTLAMVSSSFRLIAHPAIGSLNLLNHYLAIEVLKGNTLSTSFNVNQLESLSAFFMEAHHYGYLIAGGFFGIHCFLLGLQIYKSNTIPNIFGGLMIGSALGYVLETFGNFNFPQYENYTALIVGVAAGIGEVSLTLFLLIKGKLNKKPNLVQKQTS